MQECCVGPKTLAQRAGFDVAMFCGRSGEMGLDENGEIPLRGKITERQVTR
jgi:hypothetical protein